MRAAIDVTGSVVDPRLEQLVDTVVALVSGDLTVRLAPSPAQDSLDAVATGINLLAGELDTARRDLEARVAERTAAIAENQESLRRLALTDALTGLANRTLLADRIGQAVARADRGALPPAVILLDLDEFKLINDGLGHAAGDAVLVEIAERLRGVVRETDTVGRLGGDEFAIVLPDTAEAEAIRVARRALLALQVPVPVDGHEVAVSASIGLRFGVCGQDGETLLRDADIAMYRAKAQGKSNVQVFEPSMHHAAQRRMQLLGELGEAIERNELALVFQPIVDPVDGRVRGAEALLRWEHAREGTILPGSFLALAEESGLIADVGRWTLRTAARTLHGWSADLPADQPFTVHVNVSAVELRRPGWVDFVRATLAEHGIPAARLALELSAAALNGDDPAILPVLVALRELGIRIVVDDFGAGFAPLWSLRDLPVDTVKIDRAMGAPTDEAPARRRFARAVVELVASVGLTVVVQGVETAEQLDEAREWGAGTAQGWYLGRPVPPEQLIALVRAGLPTGTVLSTAAGPSASPPPPGPASPAATPIPAPGGSGR